MWISNKRWREEKVLDKVDTVINVRSPGSDSELSELGGDDDNIAIGKTFSYPE